MGSSGRSETFRVKTRHAVEVAHSADDIAVLVKTIGAGGIIERGSSRPLTAALRLQETVVSEVMVPRPDLIAMPSTASAAEYETVVVSTGHSRIPVYRSDLDDLKGFVHAKDLTAIGTDELSLPIDPGLIRKVPVVPEWMGVPPVLEMMRSQGVHLAIAVDEHGSVAGLVTLGDIAEELVGDIRDEQRHQTRDGDSTRRAQSLPGRRTDEGCPARTGRCASSGR